MPRSVTDFCKVIAAIAVVGIHATSTAENNFAIHHNFLSLDFGGVLLNQWARFSVPLFLYLSAYGLALSDKNAAEGLGSAYVNFLKKRLPAILIPYLFFTAIALLLHAQTLTPMQVFNALRTGSADYHLYFLVILAQCYLLFPLLLKLQIIAPRFFRGFVAVAFLLVVLLLYRTSSERILSYFGWNHPGWHASFFIYWLPYFMLGVVHARTPPARWGYATAIAACAIALATVLADYIIASGQGIPVDYYNHFSRPSVALYALAVIYALHTFRPHPPTPSPLTWRGGERAGSANGVSHLAPLTFSVYLIHPQVLRVVNNYWAGIPALLAWILVVITSFIAVYLLTLITNKAIEKTPSWANTPLKFVQRALGLR